MDTTLDRRVKRTHKLLGKALINLIQEQGYESVTIKDITDRADVAYVTFFRHFKDKDDLILHTLDAIVEEVIEQLQAVTQQFQTDNSTLALHECSIEEGRVIFQHAQENAAMYRVLLNKQGSLRIYQSIKERIAQVVIQDAVAMGLFDQYSPSIPVDILANHAAASLLALLDWWLEQDMPYPPDHMADIYSRLIGTPVSALALENVLEPSAE